MELVWIVEEVSAETGKTLYKELFEDYEDAHEMYNERKLHDERSFVSLYKATVNNKRD